MEDSFLTIASVSEGIYRDKGSKFMAFAYPVEREEDIREKIDSIRKKYFDARHHCYAYRLGVGGERYRVNDDGEPGNSAGKPIFGQIVSHNLTNVLVVVVRYFGGTLLGVGGLIQAYRQATANALDNAKIIQGIQSRVYSIRFDYAVMNRVLTIVKDMNLEYFDPKFDQVCSMKIKVRVGMAGELVGRLKKIESVQMAE